MPHPFVEIAEDFENAIRENEKRKRNRNYHGYLVPDSVIAKWRHRAKENRLLAKEDQENG